MITYNPSWEHYLGFPLEELPSFPNLELIHPEDRVSTIAALERLHQGETVVRYENRYQTSSGDFRWLQWKAKNRGDLAFAVARDVTEQHRIEEAYREKESELWQSNRKLEQRQKELAESEERFRKAFETSPDAININRMDGTYVEVNEGFLELMGYERQEVIGHSSLELGIWVDQNERRRLVQGLTVSGSVQNLETLFRAKDGHEIIGLMSARIVHFNGEPHILTITRDITERRGADQALAKTQQLESIGILAGGIAHDFNNLLSGLFGFLELTEWSLDDPVQAKVYLEKARAAQYRAKALTQQLLTFSKGGVPVKRRINFETLVQEACNLALSGSGIVVDLKIEPHLWSVDADEGQIHQVISNLLINARQASRDHGTVQIGVNNVIFPPRFKENEGRFVAIAVRDQGIGIPAENLKKVFDPFFTTKSTGSGLGLAVVDSILRKHGGFVEVDSRLGEKTEFRVFLPTSTAEEPARLEHKPETSSRARYKRVLVLDDEDFIRELLSGVLKHENYRVETVQSASEAIELFRQAKIDRDPFDLALFDLTLKSELGGLEAAERILEFAPEAKIVVTSGYATNEAIAHPERFGLAGSLQKPVAVPELLSLFDSLLSKSSPPERGE